MNRGLCQFLLFCLLLALVGCGGATDDPRDGYYRGLPRTPPEGQVPPAFSRVACLPIGEVVPGSAIACRFDIDGEAGQTVDISCRDASGNFPHCASEAFHLEPAGPLRLPVHGAILQYRNTAPASADIFFEVTASAADESVTRRFDYTQGDDAVAGELLVDVDCTPHASSGVINVKAGEEVICTFLAGNGQAGVLQWSVHEESGAQGVHPPSSSQGSGKAALPIRWSWRTATQESGSEWRYVLDVSAEGQAPVVRTLTIKVD